MSGSADQLDSYCFTEVKTETEMMRGCPHEKGRKSSRMCLATGRSAMSEGQRKAEQHQVRGAGYPVTSSYPGLGTVLLEGKD